MVKIHILLPRKLRFVYSSLGIFLVFVISLSSWVQWGAWPDPKQDPIFSDADAIVILGGGDLARWNHGLELAKGHPDLPLIVTGDEGHIVDYLVANGTLREHILHENAATSTVENAIFTAPMLDRIGAHRVILVTNWYHAPRSLAVFQKYQHGREFVVSFSPKPKPLTKWDMEVIRRERLAVIYNLIVHGVWCL